MMKTILQTGFVGIFLFFSALASAKEVVNIYSARHYDTDLALYNDFEKRTGIKINLIEAASDALIERILNEGQYSPADILITVDVGRLYRAEQKKLFSPIVSSVLDERVPPHLRHPEKLWYGLSKRARVIIYNLKAGKPAALNNYADLARPEFKGQLCMRSSSNIYNISLLAGMIERDGVEAAERWAAGVVANLYKKPSGNDTANIRAVASGECKLSLVNSYYVARALASGDPIAKQIGILYPNQATTGTHINISGAGVLMHAPNRDNAIRFLEYLTEPQAQAFFVAGNNEYPVVEGAEITEALAALGEFEEDRVNANALGENQATAVKVFDRTGWR